MSRYLTLLSVYIGSAILTFACASAPPPKIESAPDTQVEPSAQTVDEREGPTSTEQPSVATLRKETEGSPASTSTDVDDDTSTVRYKSTAIDEMTAGGTAYIIDYPNSGPMAAATTSCSEKAAKAEEVARAEEAAKAARMAREAKPAMVPSTEEPAKANEKEKKAQAAAAATEAAEAAAAQESAMVEKIEAVRAECMKQAREKFEADVLRFRRDGWGHIQLVISRRIGSAVKELSVTNVELKQTSRDTVRVEIKEAGLGQRPIMKDRSSFDVKIPNGYSIELEDARLGKLPYIAKVGFVAN